MLDSNLNTFGTPWRGTADFSKYFWWAKIKQLGPMGARRRHWGERKATLGSPGGPRARPDKKKEEMRRVGKKEMEGKGKWDILYGTVLDITLPFINLSLWLLGICRCWWARCAANNSWSMVTSAQGIRCKLGSRSAPRRPACRLRLRDWGAGGGF